MPEEPSQPRKLIFDHPDFAGLSKERKIGLLSQMAGLKNLAWDEDNLLIPTSTTNPAQISAWVALCEQEDLSVKEVTSEMDPGNIAPMYRYFQLSKF